MTDYFGKNIEVGNRVVYPGRSGSNLWLNDGIVTAIEEDYRRYEWSNRKESRIKVARSRGGRDVWLHEIKRVVVV